MAKKVQLSDELYDSCRQVAEISGLESAEAFVPYMLKRVVNAIEEDCDDDEDIRSKLEMLGYV
ncbi:MAG: hypothetical protein L0213_05255 [Candidatus Dadabacteria bacterium]|nr:hypothetical protein [Candidatus Dadabacteria bacterium]